MIYIYIIYITAVKYHSYMVFIVVPEVEGSDGSQQKQEGSGYEHHDPGLQ